MKTKLFESKILVQKYEYGKPFPGLYSELEGTLPKLPLESRQMPLLEGGISGKFGVIQTERDGILLVADGAYMQVTTGVGGLNLPSCIGRVPSGYYPPTPKK